MRRKIPFVAASLLALAVAYVTCGGGKKNSGDATAKTVYVAGQSNDRATLWKDSAPQQLSTTGNYSWATSVFVSGSDVYVGGLVINRFSWDADIILPTIWMNGVSQQLSTTGNYSFVNSVFVNDSDVYVAGDEGFVEVEPYHDFRAVLWTNGVRQLLGTSKHSSASSVYVAGKDVYVAGQEDDDAVLWKNGIRQELSISSAATRSYAFSVYVSGSDVYVAGAETFETLNNDGSYSLEGHAVLWTNGARQQLSSNNNSTGPSANSVFVSGKDVYVAGWDGNAVLWKNGTRQQLSNATVAEGSTEANSVYVSGTDVYVAGLEYKFPYDIGSVRCVLWKNGVRQSLGVANHVNSVFVK